MNPNSSVNHIGERINEILSPSSLSLLKQIHSQEVGSHLERPAYPSLDISLTSSGSSSCEDSPRERATCNRSLQCSFSSSPEIKCSAKLAAVLSPSEMRTLQMLSLKKVQRSLSKPIFERVPLDFSSESEQESDWRDEVEREYSNERVCSNERKEREENSGRGRREDSYERGERDDSTERGERDDSTERGERDDSTERRERDDSTERRERDDSTERGESEDCNERGESEDCNERGESEDGCYWDKNKDIRGLTTGEARGSLTTGQAQGRLTPWEARGRLTTGEARGSLTIGDARGGLTTGEARGGLTTGEAQGSLTTEEAQGCLTTGEAQRGLTTGEAQGSLTTEEDQHGLTTGEATGGLTAGKTSELLNFCDNLSSLEEDEVFAEPLEVMPRKIHQTKRTKPRKIEAIQDSDKSSDEEALLNFYDQYRKKPMSMEEEWDFDSKTHRGSSDSFINDDSTESDSDENSCKMETLSKGKMHIASRNSIRASSSEESLASSYGDSGGAMSRSDGSPEHEANGSLEHEANGSLEHEANGSPEHEANGSLEHEANGSPEHEANGSPEHEANGSPEHEANGSPEHEANGSPEHGKAECRSDKAVDCERSRTAGHSGNHSQSFLRSLSENDDYRIPLTAKFLQHFKRHYKELTEQLRVIYNKELFEGKLSEVEVVWNRRLTKTAGRCINGMSAGRKKSTIELSVKVCDRAHRVRDTLLHEMCHAAAWLISNVKNGHGQIWKSWAARANSKFPNILIVSRCHDYSIDCKYKYTCTSCGYTIQRHSKSLDTKGKICGYCESPFQLKNPTNVKPLTPFASFVKDRYKEFRTPGTPHGDVMKILSKEFSAKMSVTSADEF